MDAYAESERFSASTEKWTKLRYRAVDTDDRDFRTNIIAPAVGASNAMYMGFMVQAPDSTGANIQLYEYEATSNLEYQGAKVTGKEPSHADPTGFSAVNAISVFSRAMVAPSQTDDDDVGDALLEGTQDYIDRHQSHVSGAKSAKVHQKLKSKTNGWDAVLGIGGEVLKQIPGFLSWLL